MRDTLIGLSLLAALIGGYLYTRGLSSENAGKLAPSAVAAKSSSRSKSIHTTRSKSAGGFAHARKVSEPVVGQSRQDQREDEGSAGEADDASQLPTLYSGESDRAGESAARSESPVGKPASKRVKPKIVHGVAVDAWAGLQKNALARPAVSGPGKDGVRVIFQCHEMKDKGAEYVGERSCGEIAAKGRESTSAVIGRGSDRVY